MHLAQSSHQTQSRLALLWREHNVTANAGQSVMRFDMREHTPYHDKVPDSTACLSSLRLFDDTLTTLYFHALVMLSNSVYHIEPSRSSGSGLGVGSSKAQKLVLTTTSLRNVVLANASDVLYYEVVTPVWERHRTRVSRLDIKTRGFNIVAEMLNGHAPGDVKGREEDAKRVMALRMYGGGEYRAVDDFLHVESNLSNGGDDAHPDPKGKGKGREKEMVEMSVVLYAFELDLDFADRTRNRRAWFRGKDGFRYTWIADEKRLEVRHI